MKLARLMLSSRNFERRCKSSFRASAAPSMLLNREDQVFVMLVVMLLLLF